MSDYDVELDTSGLNCPLPVLKARKALSSMTSGQTLHITVTDPSANKDIPAFCKISGNALVETTEQEDKIYFVIKKG